MSLEALNAARYNLTEALGETSTLYFNQMKLWFKMKISKEEFDSEARSLLSHEQIHLHNQFFLCLLNKVEGLSEATTHDKVSSHNKNSRRHKRSSRSTSEKSNFEPADLIDYLPPNSPPGATDGVKYAAQEYFLPDHSLIVGRFMLTAWEQGLEGAQDEAADVVVVGLQYFLKNILEKVIAQRKGYKVRNGGFVYDYTSDVPNMWLRNTAKVYDPQDDTKTVFDENLQQPVPNCPPIIDEVEHSKAYEIACSSVDNLANTGKITLDEVYNTLRIHRNIIPSHSIYAVNMERMALMLNHPSY